MTKILAAACLILIALTADASARCSVPRFFVPENQTADAYMTVSSGDRCSIRLRLSSGPTHGVVIVQRPTHGSVATQAPNGVVYRSRSGYVGNDEFTYAWRGLGTNNNQATRTVRVKVTVTAQ